MQALPVRLSSVGSKGKCDELAKVLSFECRGSGRSLLDRRVGSRLLALRGDDPIACCDPGGRWEDRRCGGCDRRIGQSPLPSRLRHDIELRRASGSVYGAKRTAELTSGGWPQGPMQAAVFLASHENHDVERWVPLNRR